MQPKRIIFYFIFTNAPPRDCIIVPPLQQTYTTAAGGRIDIKTDFISVSPFTSFVKFIYVSKRFPLQHISQMRRVSCYFTPILFLAIRATKPSSFIYAFISRRIICYDLSVTICTFKFSYRIPFLYFLLCKSFPHFNHHSVQLRL